MPDPAEANHAEEVGAQVREEAKPNNVDVLDAQQRTIGSSAIGAIDVDSRDNYSKQQPIGPAGRRYEEITRTNLENMDRLNKLYALRKDLHATMANLNSLSTRGVGSQNNNNDSNNVIEEPLTDKLLVDDIEGEVERIKREAISSKNDLVAAIGKLRQYFKVVQRQIDMVEQEVSDGMRLSCTALSDAWKELDEKYGSTKGGGEQ